MPLKKCLVANRGEIAIRIMRACRELGIQTVAVHSHADAQDRHVQFADEAYQMGDAPQSPRQSYLDGAALIAVAVDAECDCIHPGYGFLSENEEFAQQVLDAGLTWIGPSPDAIRRMGVKTEARALMQAAGVPVVPGFQSESASVEIFVQEAARIGYPIMVKAAGGGGGKGIRVVYNPPDLPEAIESAQREAQHAFNDPRVFLERYIETGRHIEIQVLADSHGNTVHLFERECSAQRRHQKIIEESPSPLLTAAMRDQMGQAAVAAARAVNYVNAGTVEFIATPQGDFYFLEMNTRLQVEHPVTEAVTGLDLVKLQFRIAAGEALPFTQADLMQRGHAIECRLYAEDPRQNFMPATGRVLRFTPPQTPGVRVDTGIQSGSEITIYFDPMIAKIIVYDPTRTGAITKMEQALRETILLGPTTNRDFLLALLAHPTFQAGEVDTRFVDTNLETLMPPVPDVPFAALIAAALSEVQVSTTSSVSTRTDNDPWSRSDGFRIGQ
jgi:acetyl-CoA carboxylase biotin carboxylase subunit